MTVTSQYLLKTLDGKEFYRGERKLFKVKAEAFRKLAEIADLTNDENKPVAVELHIIYFEDGAQMDIDFCGYIGWAVLAKP